ncbi:MAG: autotransporter domain-containing protein [Terrimicrobiaceae bacterium]|nr:autotransporter domain-containing protein [Terrimicrobiaceae bacterium]
MPPVTPLQDALFQDIAGNTNVRVVGLGGGALLALPRNLRFTNNMRSYTIAVPSGSGLRPQSITVDGSGPITFNGTGVIRGQLLTLGRLTINGTGNSTLTIDTLISDGAFDLPTRLVLDRESGQTVISGSNDFSGGTTLRQGSLVLADDDALGTGTLRIEGGLLANDGNARQVGVDVEMEGDFTLSDSGGGVFFTGGFEAVSGDRQILLAGNDGEACFESVLSGDADSLTLALADGTDSFSISFCGPDSNTFAGQLVVADGVGVSLEKDAGLVAVAGDLDVQNGGAVQILGGLDQMAETSSVNVDGEMAFLFLSGSSTASWNALTGSGLVENVLGPATLRLAGGDYSGQFVDAGPDGSLTIQKWSEETLTLSGLSTITGGLQVQGGTVEIVEGGVLEAGSSLIGGVDSFLSRVEVVGAKSAWYVLGNLTVEGFAKNGKEIPATLRVADGGLLDVTGTLSLKTGSVVETDGSKIAAEGGARIESAVIRLLASALLDLPELAVETALFFDTAGFDGEFDGGIEFDGTFPFLYKDGEGSLSLGGLISGGGGLIVREGTLSVLGANTFTGAVQVLNGTLRTTNTQALGAGPLVSLEGGALRPEGGLSVNAMDWLGGTIELTLGTATDRLTVINELYLTPTSGTFAFTDGAGFLPNTPYTIVTAGSWNEVLLGAFSGNSLLGLSPTFTRTGADLMVEFIGAITGPVLQNAAPFYTPVDADFLVDGAVSTGTPADNNSVNSLRFLAGGWLRIFNTLLVQQGRFDVQNGVAGLTGGTVAVPGSFLKTGPGSLTVNSTVFVDGSTLVEQGALFVNGLFQSKDGVTVFDQAILGGIGQIIGNLLNRGTLAPGNSPGTLQINGDFTQASSGTFELEIAGLSTFDRLLVSGTANLAGTLNVVNLGSSLEYGQAYPFLQAETIDGTFDTISVPNPDVFRGRFVAENGTGTLLIAPTSYTLVAQNPNQRRVAAALDGFIPATGGDRLTVSTALDRLQAEQFPAAFDQILPGLHATVTDLLIGQAFNQTQMLNQRLSSVRLGAEGFQAFGIPTEPLKHDIDGKSVAEPKSAKTFIQTIARPRWSAWAMGNGQFARITSVNQLPNGRSDSGGVLAGADYRWSEQFTTGLYVGYQGTYADFGAAGDLRSNAVLFGGYATFQSGGFYADAILGGGYSNAKVRRSIDFSTIDRTARSQQDSGQFNASLNLGYDWSAAGFTFGPVAGLQYTYAGVAPFTETGAQSLNLAVARQHANSIRSTLGGRIAYTWNPTPKFALIPEIRVLWQHEFINSSRTLQSALDGGTGDSFGYRVSAPGQDSVFAGAGVSAQIGESWNASVFYNVDFGRQDYLAHLISAGLAWKF